MTTPSTDMAPYGTFTLETAKAANSLQAWVRFSALILGLFGTLALVASVTGSGVIAARKPEFRPLIAAVGTLYAASSLAMLCAAFLLSRYSTKVEQAAKQRRAAALLDAMPYETGYWMMTAAYTVAWLLSMAVAFTSPQARRELAASSPVQEQRAATADMPELPEEVATRVNAIAGGFAIAGAVLILSALRPAGGRTRP